MAAQRRSSKGRRRGSAAVADPAAQAVASQSVAVEEPVKKAEVPSSKSAAVEKPSKFRTTRDRLTRTFQNTVSEIKKITWPDWETTRNLTALVIAMSTVLGLLLGGIDYLLLKLFETF